MKLILDSLLRGNDKVKHYCLYSIMRKVYTTLWNLTESINSATFDHCSLKIASLKVLFLCFLRDREKKNKEV